MLSPNKAPTYGCAIAFATLDVVQLHLRSCGVRPMLDVCKGRKGDDRRGGEGKLTGGSGRQEMMLEGPGGGVEEMVRMRCTEKRQEGEGRPSEEHASPTAALCWMQPEPTHCILCTAP